MTEEKYDEVRIKRYDKLPELVKQILRKDYDITGGLVKMLFKDKFLIEIKQSDKLPSELLEETR